MNYDEDDLDLWINAGVHEVMGAVEFDDAKLHATVDIAAGAYEYGLPAEVLAITSVGWASENIWLIKMNPDAMLGLKRATGGRRPTRYAKRGRTLMLYDTPDRDGTLDLFYIADLPLNSDADSVTPYPSTWDEAIYRFSAAAAFYDLNDDERGLFWHDRAVKYAGSRILESEMGAEATSAPVQVVSNPADLHKGRSF